MASKVQITLHYLNRSRAQRIIWLLEELRLPYALKTYTRAADQQAPPSLKAVHPLGKAPVLELMHARMQKPLVLAESANIVEYIAEHFGSHLIPQRWKGEEKEVGDETDEWMRYKFYMGYSEGSLMNLIGTGALKNAIKSASVPFFIKPITGRIAGQLESDYLNHNYESHLSFLESEMAKVVVEPQEGADVGPFVCGPKLTAVDFMMAFPLEAAQQIAGLSEEKYPVLTDYLKRVQGREAYQRAIERIIKETGKYEPGI